VELENGDVMINSRNYVDRVPVGCRAVTLASFDQQGKIQFHPTYHDETLVSPSVQASIIRYTRTDQPEFGGRSRILFSNPNHPKARYNLTVRLSYDEGKTWPVSKVIDPGPSAYSDLVIQDDMKIGVLYERGNQGGISFINFQLDWLTDGSDPMILENKLRSMPGE
jgi:sialidase-1